MKFEDTLAFCSYLCLARICGMSDDDALYDQRLDELFDIEIDQVFSSQYVVGAEGKRWAFTDPNDHRGDELEARLFYARDHDRYFLVHRPTQAGNVVDNVTNVETISGLGVPDKFCQAARLMANVRPEYRDRIVLAGHSLGGGLAAYAAITAPWSVRTIAFDPLGLNGAMMAEFAGPEDNVDWYYISGSWVAEMNVNSGLSSVGTVWELPQDPIHAKQPGADAHDLENVRYGLRYLWDQNPEWRSRAAS